MNILTYLHESVTHTYSSKFRYACESGDAETAQRLLNRVEQEDLCYGFADASENGHVKVVKLLLADERVDPTTGENWAIRLACKNDHVEVVRILLEDPRVDPKARNSYAIRWACMHDHVEVVKMLLQDPRVDASYAMSFNPIIQELLAQWKYYPR